MANTIFDVNKSKKLQKTAYFSNFLIALADFSYWFPCQFIARRVNAFRD
jgi:hypothetical protein